MRLRGFLAGSALALSLALTACSGNTAAGGGGDAGAGTTVTVGTDTGAELKYEPALVEAPANSQVKLVFQNKSTSQPHNLVFQQAITAKTSDSVAPGQSETLEITTPGAGSYKFTCTLHPGMDGTLNVK